MHLHPWDKDSVRIIVRVNVEHKNEAIAREYLQRMEVRSEGNKDYLTLTTILNDRDKSKDKNFLDGFMKIN